MICVTFDTDHMTEQGLERFLAEYPFPGTATFFAHRRFAALEASGHEICPHPFIEDLRDWRSSLKSITREFPHAPKGVRPHCCVFSHMIGIGLKDEGYLYVSQAQNLFTDGLAPFRHPWGVWELPIYYMDNMDFWMSKNWPELRHRPFDHRVIDRALGSDALFVFDFHPLHIALNSGSHEFYSSVKARIIEGGESPFDLRAPGRGTADFFAELCVAMRRANVQSVSCAEAVARVASA